MLNLLDSSTDSWVINYVAENFTKIEEGKLLSKRVFECNNPWLYLKYQILYECKKTCITTYIVPIEVKLSEYLADRVAGISSEVTDSKETKIKIEDNFLFTHYVLKKLFKEKLMPSSLLVNLDVSDIKTNYTVVSDVFLFDWIAPETFVRFEDLRTFLENNTSEPEDSLASIYLMFAQQMYGFAGDFNEGYAEHVIFRYLGVPYYFPYEWEIYEASR